MSLWIEWEVEEELSVVEELNALCTTVAQRVLESEGVLTPVEIALTVVSEEEIQQLNQEFREIDRVTDVLSFPQWDYEGQAPERVLSTAEKDLDTGEVCLGDIVICLQRARDQAAEYGHSLQREMAFLTAHSMLHLLGYDHMTEEEEKVMFGKQEAVLTSLNILR